MNYTCLVLLLRSVAGRILAQTSIGCLPHFEHVPWNMIGKSPDCIQSFVQGWEKSSLSPEVAVPLKIIIHDNTKEFCTVCLCDFGTIYHLLIFWDNHLTTILFREPKQTQTSWVHVSNTKYKVFFTIDNLSLVSNSNILIFCLFIQNEVQIIVLNAF